MTKEGKRGEEKKREEEKKRGKRKIGGILPIRVGSSLSHFEGGFPKVLREWILGFGGRKEGRQRGSSRESYRYEIVCFSRFLLRLSLPLIFATSF